MISGKKIEDRSQESGVRSQESGDGDSCRLTENPKSEVPNPKRGARWSKTRSRSGKGRFLDFSGFQTLGAHPHPTNRAIDDGPNSLQVGVPAPLGQIVGMRHIIPEAGSLSTNLTKLRHSVSKKVAETGN